MTNPDITTWANSAATLVIGQLPLQSLQNAVDLSFAYISNVGGWVPDDPAQPNGPGMPLNGASPTTAAADITEQQIAQVYDLKFVVNINLSCQFIQHLGTGLDLAAAAAAMAADVETMVENSINDSNLPIRFESVVLQVPTAPRSLLGGATTQSVRGLIATDATGTDKIIDYKAACLLQATNDYGLDDTWNVEYVYTQENRPIVVVVTKYTDNTYATLDSGNTTLYVYTVSPTTHQIVAGTVLS